MHPLNFVLYFLQDNFSVIAECDIECCGLLGVLTLSKKRAVPSLLSLQTYKPIILLKWGILSDLFNKISNIEIKYSTRGLNNRAEITL